MSCRQLRARTLGIVEDPEHCLQVASHQGCNSRSSLTRFTATTAAPWLSPRQRAGCGIPSFSPTRRDRVGPAPSVVISYLLPHRLKYIVLNAFPCQEPLAELPSEFCVARLSLLAANGPVQDREGAQFMPRASIRRRRPGRKSFLISETSVPQTGLRDPSGVKSKSVSTRDYGKWLARSWSEDALQQISEQGDS